MKILISDDEQHIRNGLKMSIDWKRLKIEDVFVAGDGPEALAICRRERPEIILTDIRMPGIDGLELAKEAMEFHGTKKVLIMSGYSEFSYAKSAVQLGAVDYLLKPIKLGEVERILEEIVHKISEEEKREKLFSQDIMKDIILGNVLIEDIRKEIPEKYKNAGEMFCVILRTEQIYAGMDKSEAREKLSGIAAELEQRELEIISQDRDELVVVWSAGSYQKRSMYRSLIGSALADICRADHQCAAGVSMVGSFREIHKLYIQAEKALKYRICMEKDSVIFYEDICDITDTKSINFSWKKIREQISGLEIESVYQVIAESFGEFRTNRCLARGKIQEFCIVFKNILVDELKDRGIELAGIMKKNAELFEKQLEYDVLSSYENWLKDCCYLILKGASEITGKKYHSAVKKAIAYVNENYSRDITLSAIAEDVQKSTNYFCYIFKKDTGMNFNEYLNLVRIEKAKELLKTSEYMVYEISERVGYHDYTYFAKVFKKICGCSPSEYKEEKS